MAVVYIDSVFLLNTATDYLLLLATARLAGIRLRRRRYVFSALLGGCYAAAAFLPNAAFLTHPAVKIAAGVLLALFTFGGEERLLRLILLFFSVSCGFAGCVLALGLLLDGVPMLNGILYTDVNTGVLAAAFGAGYLVLRLVFLHAARHGLQGDLLPVRISIGGRIAALTALWDSGNTLRDTVSGEALLIVAPGQLDNVLPKGVHTLLQPERLRTPTELLAPLLRAAPVLAPHLTPYRAVGTADGLLLTVKADWVEIGGQRQNGARIALSPTALGNGYGALWGGELKKGRQK